MKKIPKKNWSNFDENFVKRHIQFRKKILKLEISSHQTESQNFFKKSFKEGRIKIYYLWYLINN